MTISAVPAICFACLRFRPATGDQPRATCAAFERGIPEEVLFKGADHRYPLPDDGGVLFLLDPKRQAHLDFYESRKAMLSGGKIAE